MDAPAENDVQLQRISKGLLAEFGASLPRYLWASHIPGGLQRPQKDKVCRRFVKQSKTNHLIKLVRPKVPTLNYEILYINGLFGAVVGTFPRMATVDRSAFETIRSHIGVCFLGLFVQ